MSASYVFTCNLYHNPVKETVFFILHRGKLSHGEVI